MYKHSKSSNLAFDLFALLIETFNGRMAWKNTEALSNKNTSAKIFSTDSSEHNTSTKVLFIFLNRFFRNNTSAKM
jgi:hypothetical protein